VELAPFLTELARTVRSGGRIGLLEVSSPDRPILRWGHSVYFGSVVPRIGGLLSDRSAYAYLPQSVSYLPPPAQLGAMVEGAGFTSVERRQLTGGIAQLYVATRV
jgi:demethylmenaquinone methyltransferase / 2-methoxy-6-polyprenyl-1,4-benzoquinol methylase